MYDGTNFRHFFFLERQFSSRKRSVFVDNWLDIWLWYVGSEHECHRFFLKRVMQVMGMKVNTGRNRQVEFRTAACSRERICGFPGVKIVQGEDKKDSSASDIRKLVFYQGIV